MSQDLANVGRNAMNVTKADIHTPYTNVIVTYSTKTEDGETVERQYIARNGTNEGQTLEVYCPWGTQAMADNLLAKMNGVRYKPYTVTSALLDPSVELGDAVNTNAVFGGMYTQQSTFGHGFYSDYSAPEDEQMNHEYKYESSTERRITRETSETKSFFRATADEINAEVATKVAKEGGKVQANSFGWKLLDNSFTLYSNGNAVFTCTKSGLTVTGDGTFGGTLYAKDGRIGATKNAQGNWTGGFILTASKFYTDGHTAYNTNTNGVYVGTDGIGCGGSFSVTSGGVLNASSATIKGNLTVDSITFSSGVTINGSNITDGTVSDGKISGVSGSKVGSGIAGANINDGTIGDAKISDVGGAKVGSGIAGANINESSIPRNRAASSMKTSLDNGDTAKASYDSLVSGSVTATWLKADSVQAGTLRVKNSSNVYQIASWKSATIDGTTIKYIGHD